MRTRYVIASALLVALLCVAMATAALHWQRATIPIFVMVMGPFIAAGALVGAVSLVEPAVEVQPRAAPLDD